MGFYEGSFKESSKSSFMGFRSLSELLLSGGVRVLGLDHSFVIHFYRGLWISSGALFFRV